MTTLKPEASPPGPVTVTWEWSMRVRDLDPNTWPKWSTTSETEARNALRDRCVAGATLIRRERWTAIGDWEDVAP